MRVLIGLVLIAAVGVPLVAVAGDDPVPLVLGDVEVGGEGVPNGSVVGPLPISTAPCCSTLYTA